ncbi:GNAT family N-acetyltransferase [Sphingopyxis sp. JAI108]|uniref:GNAT family N-acetyltransferase n=1 Tax=Sphingopyxis sp. JAI108 TaxID=2723060 RepID=UPI00180F051C|nr:GNAT family N-acetyltransferase [Sphingopyxis sp. JAI108]NYF32600.1 ribosomal protein S18 acetylase RimI-like enzyme [Sphingopyxis sp. JAI108]
MAEHRGMKLVRSRKRTPGVGDFGKFGLTDGAGKPLLGIGKQGLTASAADVAQYLRGGAANSWKLSAEREPQAKTPKKPRKPAAPAEEPASIRRRARTAAPPPSRRRQDPPPPPRAKPVLRSVEPEAPPAPELNLRPATAKDRKALSRLLAQLADPPKRGSLDANFDAIGKSGAGLLIAEVGVPVGCCAWAVVPTLQHGLVGRVSLLLVDGNHRRSGVGTALVAAAEAALAKAGCATIEVMSDIMIDNAHNFFRALKFEQKSYRFVRATRSLQKARRD